MERKARRNGVIKINNPSSIPDEFKLVRVEMMMEDFKRILNLLRDTIGWRGHWDIERIVDLPRVQAALEQWERTIEPCPCCGPVAKPSAITNDCPICHGQKTIRAASPCPGAELIR